MKTFSIDRVPIHDGGAQIGICGDMHHSGLDKHHGQLLLVTYPDYSNLSHFPDQVHSLGHYKQTS
jgi:hypothetical protein